MAVAVACRSQLFLAMLCSPNLVAVFSQFLAWSQLLFDGQLFTWQATNAYCAFNVLEAPQINMRVVAPWAASSCHTVPKMYDAYGHAGTLLSMVASVGW